MDATGRRLASPLANWEPGFGIIPIQICHGTTSKTPRIQYDDNDETDRRQMFEEQKGFSV
jgi:hypothetical protein